MLSIGVKRLLVGDGVSDENGIKRQLAPRQSKIMKKWAAGILLSQLTGFLRLFKNHFLTIGITQN